MGVVLGIKEDGDKEPVKVDDEGRVYVTTNPALPIEVRASEAIPVTTTTSDGIAQTHEAGNAKAVTTTAASLALPEENGFYLLQARGCDVHLLTQSGSAPTATAGAGGYSLVVMDGQTLVVQLSGDYLSYIGTEGGFFVCCHLDRS
jgi:hypothetical protein